MYDWEEDGKKHINIRIPITYVGEGATSEVIAKFNKGIEEYWSGEIGKYIVQTVVTDDKSLELMNTITVPIGNDWAKSYVPGPTGIWPSERPEWTAAQEAGHLLGLHDMYDRETGKVPDEWKDNIMAVRDKRPDERNIDEILDLRVDNVIRSGTSNGTEERKNEPIGITNSFSKKNH